MHTTKLKVGFAKSPFSYQTYLCDTTQGTGGAPHPPPPPPKKKKLIPSFFFFQILIRNQNLCIENIF